MKSLRIFEEKKNKKRKVKTERKLYRSYILSTWIPCKKKKTIQPTILCTLPNHYYTYKKTI